MKVLPENLNYKHLSLADASIIAGKSKNTIRRKKAELEELGAICEPSGWILTVNQLATVGLLDTVTAEVTPTPPAPVPEPSHGTLSNELKKLYEERIDDLKKALEREQKRADIAEARLERLLPAGSSIEPTVDPLIKTSIEDQKPESKQGLFSRWFGR